MSYTCDSFCREGNCEGCNNGKLNCKDPRCFPYCSSQCVVSNEWKMITGILLIVLVIIAAAIISYLLIFEKNN